MRTNQSISKKYLNSRRWTSLWNIVATVPELALNGLVFSRKVRLCFLPRSESDFLPRIDPSFRRKNASLLPSSEYPTFMRVVIRSFPPGGIMINSPEWWELTEARSPKAGQHQEVKSLHQRKPREHITDFECARCHARIKVPQEATADQVQKIFQKHREKDCLDRQDLLREWSN